MKVDTMHDTISEVELENMKARAAAARAGPWQSYVEGRDHTSGSNFIRVGPDEARGEDIELIGATVDDQDFIAHARQDLPRLIAEVEGLWAKHRRSRQ
jgi:hypothetical protein